MRYRLTCLTPLLVGDGRRLSPIDYMVWKDQVNVLDQRRIFRLLAKGPRLDNYLLQLKKADKLEFASWGGFAQNFADRRIPFEHSSLSACWEQARGDSLHIPTFASGPAGPYLPGSAIKGALRTGLLSTRMKEGALRDTATQFQGDRPPRRPAEMAEERALGGGGVNRLKPIAAGDSAPVAVSSFKVFLLRVSTLQARGPGRYELGWKQSPRGTVDGRRPEDSTPVFAEMAAPGTVFSGAWQEKGFYAQPEVLRAIGWREPLSRSRLFESANQYAAQLLALHKQYAAWTGLGLVGQCVERLEAELARLRESGTGCLLCLGWASGLLAKISFLQTEHEAYKQILRQLPIYGRTVDSGLPFPKTRRIVFLENRPASLPGWAALEVDA